jgi:glycosyltransferase involved in cell wall biosynthesis
MVIKTSVIVPAYNAQFTIKNCLDGLLSQITLGALEIIVVNDGSTDYTASIVSEYKAKGVRLINLPHSGAAVARNRGVSEACPTSEFILFTDSDCVPVENWAQVLISALTNAPPTIAGIGGTYLTKQKNSIARFAQLEYSQRYERFNRRNLQPDFADTYSAIFRRAVLIQYPYDESLPGAVVEDAELGWRLRKVGYHFLFEPAAVVHHTHPATTWQYAQRKFRIGLWRVVIYRRYPIYLKQDSHTSQLAKLQMSLLGLLGSLIGLSVIANLLKFHHNLNKSFGYIWRLCFLLLQLSYLPNLGYIWRKDRRLIWSAFYCLNLRTLAYTSGMVWGIFNLIWKKFRD